MNAARRRRVSQRARRHVQWPMVLWLTLVWWVLWGTWSAMSLVGGVLVATAALLLFPLPPLDLDVRVRPIGTLVLVGRFLVDVVTASLQVAWTVLRPPRDLRNALVRVPLRSESDLVLVMVAELVSLVPGTVVVEVHRSSFTLYLHVLDVREPADVEPVRERVWAQEARVLRALSPRPAEVLAQPVGGTEEAP
ncbi:Na+/H+ antiporter subunit E [Nocardioides dongxiaopingii]|uniref:Na+/H+ antiporter subunit E n=1 Tax=Nocardioides sp. S-1144 TaxID=2582905 RepID=UPI00110F64EC|nr:Na+/H+ antiporter subunit E [Nocardioides sp. S-1144]QCW49994.1 Na+/H+ antiporter subunit E [Nocardioides sp. S-1144]